MRHACERTPTDWATVLQMSHKLKATIAMMGISQLQLVVAQIEKYAQQEVNTQEIVKLISQTEQIYALVKVELQARLELFQQEVS
jgi:HPt (histidine-containing phosphotransfer) domain-containing protein